MIVRKLKMMASERSLGGRIVTVLDNKEVWCDWHTTPPLSIHRYKFHHFSFNSWQFSILAPLHAWVPLPDVSVCSSFDNRSWKLASLFYQISVTFWAGQLKMSPLLVLLMIFVSLDKKQLSAPHCIHGHKFLTVFCALYILVESPSKDIVKEGKIEKGHLLK